MKLAGNDSAAEARLQTLEQFTVTPVREDWVPHEITSFFPFPLRLLEGFGQGGVLGLYLVTGVDHHESAANRRRHKSHQGFEPVAFVQRDSGVTPGPAFQFGVRGRM